MSGPYTQVESSFEAAHSYAQSAGSQMSTFTNALASAIPTAATINLDWNSVSPPSPPAVPTAPSMAPVTFTVPPAPAPFNLSSPTINISSFNDQAPNIGTLQVPQPNYGVAPTIPQIGDVDLPNSPSIELPIAPNYLTVSTVSFSGLDLHEDWLDKLENLPELELVSPTPYSYARGPEYASALLDAVKAQIQSRLEGGTGLAPDVEQAIWDRARDRETRVALANEADIQRSAEALGFQLPSGVVAAQMREARRDYYGKLSDLSRDIAIKQAELEQANAKDAIAEGMALESKLLDYSLQLEQLTFESAKTLADNAIQSYNAQVDAYKALLQGYQTYASNYKTVIDAELAEIEVYKAKLQGEQTKAEVNRTLVEQFKAQIEANMSKVEIYRAQVGAAQTLIQLEQAKIGAAGEQVKAYVARINGETAKIEAYKAGVQAQVAGVSAYEAKARAFSAKAGAEAEKAKAEIARYGAAAQAKQAEWEGYKALVQAEGEKARAIGLQNTALVDGYKAVAMSAEAQGKINAAIFQASIGQYEASKQAAIQTAKINADVQLQTAAARLDAAKVGAQVYAQLTSSAYSMINASASISASGSTSVSYSYGGDVSGDVSPMTAV